MRRAARTAKWLLIKRSKTKKQKKDHPETLGLQDHTPREGLHRPGPQLYAMGPHNHGRHGPSDIHMLPNKNIQAPRRHREGETPAHMARPATPARSARACAGPPLPQLRDRARAAEHPPGRRAAQPRGATVRGPQKLRGAPLKRPPTSTTAGRPPHARKRQRPPQAKTQKERRRRIAPQLGIAPGGTNAAQHPTDNAAPGGGTDTRAAQRRHPRWRRCSAPPRRRPRPR